MNNTVVNADDYLRGQKDCNDGTPSKPRQSEDYYRGYSTRFQHEQNMTAMTELMAWT